MPRLRSLVPAALAVLASAPSGASGYVIGPGVAADFPYSSCTLNFVFDGVGDAAGRVFVGTAAHCASGPQPGDEVRMSGDAVEFGEVIGTIVAIGDYHRPGENPSVDDDWALVEIRRRFHPDVDPAVRGHAEYPRRVVSTAEMGSGDVLQFSGHGAASQHVESAREDRQGQWVGGDEAGYDAFAPLTSGGDSGGPVVDVKTGGALGIVSTALRGFCGACTLEGPTITHLISEAAERGLTVALRRAGASAPPRPATPAPAADAPAPQPAGPAPSAAPEPARLRLSASGRGCVRAGRLTLRLRATRRLASARITGPRRAVVLRSRALARRIRLSGLRGRRVRITVMARTADGERVAARRAFPAC